MKKKKKITIIISYDYEDKNTVSNDRIADRVKNDLLKGSNPNHEKIESVTVEDNPQYNKERNIYGIFSSKQNWGGISI